MPDEFRNSFLRSLPEPAFAALKPHLHYGILAWNRVICDDGRDVETVQFPDGALISLISTARVGETVETMMVGCEGAKGLVEAAGSGVSSGVAVVQVEGPAWWAPIGVCRRLIHTDEGFSRAAGMMVELQLIESRQSGLCHAMHGVEPRLARWLLELSERSGARDTLTLTQEFMAAMLGVQRTTVNGVASQLQKTGLIRYSRGALQILDVEGLRRRACECRDVVREHRARLGLAVAG